MCTLSSSNRKYEAFALFKAGLWKNGMRCGYLYVFLMLMDLATSDGRENTHDGLLNSQISLQ